MPDSRPEEGQPSRFSSNSVEGQGSPPSISLPKGGGAIHGIGEKFAANPVTGTGSMTVPIATSPGRSGFGPQLALAYDSGSGNGPYGFGWSLSLPSITRKTDKGLPQYNDADASDVFILSGAEDLVPLLEADETRHHEDTAVPGYTIERYRPRIEGLFARIERWTKIADPSDVHWRSISKDNILTLYGKGAHSRIVDPESSNRIFSWLICETRDDKGNAILYDYKREDGTGIDMTRASERNRGDRNDPRRTANRYLKHIRYGNRTPLLNSEKQRPRFLTETQVLDAGWMFQVVFDYGEHDADTPRPNDPGHWAFRADSFSSYRAGFELRTTRLCQRVLMFHHFDGEEAVGNDCLVRSTDFSYSHDQDPTSVRNPIYTFLRVVTQTAYKRKGRGYQKRNLPPIEFEYTQAIVQDSVEEVDSAELENLPMGVDGAAYQWTDLHGEGIPGILTEQAGAWFFKRNISPIGRHRVAFTPLERVAVKPNLALAAGAQFMDLAGDGLPDLVVLDDPIPGLYEHNGNEGWQPFRPFTSRLNRGMRDPNLKFVDLDGDGHADILITEDEAFVWHPSLAEEGFGPARRVAQTLDEEKGPRLVFADGTQSIYLADLCGDGLTDLVRVRNGAICYWPNLGYGHFGAKVTMDHAPLFDHRDQFDHKRIRLADIDGSGTVDIIYLHRDGVRLYFNQSGNAWSDPQVLSVFPRVDDLVSIMPTDLLGNGTACLVWSSPLPGDTRRPMRYVNLMGGQKPHLLIKTRNNLGAETQIQYAPSTKFYLQDKRAGQPWITKLPFPVHVVEKVIVKDKWRKTRFSTTYSYHHGYFDRFEREFRGFGRVEQVDVEDYGTFEAGNTASPYITDDKTLYQPPVKTITWFHTGAFLERDQILKQFEHEYFPNNLAPERRPGLSGFQEKQLPPPDLADADLDAQGWREALRACKGLMLRQEIYELDIDVLEHDGTQRPVKLFSTAYTGCHIKVLQTRGDNKHAVFLATESEAIVYNYELDLGAEISPPDPRIAHTLNLKTDDYGNVLQSVVAVYPRRQVYEDASLPDNAAARITQVQQETHLAYTENRFTHDVTDDVDNYRLRLPSEVLNYELSGITLPAARDYFDLQQLRQYRLSEIHQSSGSAVTEIDYHRIADRSIPQKRAVQHVRILYFSDDLETPLALGELNSLALPFEIDTLAMTDDLLTAILGDKFTPEIQTDLANASLSAYQYLPDTAQYWIRSGIAGFASDAADHFYLPERYTDPFGNTTTLEYDSRDLFITRSTDPIGNRVQVTAFDYRVLQPGEIEDINGNLARVVFDILGMPTAIALRGKGREGDSLEDFSDALVNPTLDTRIRFFTDAFHEADARRLLSGATTRHLYDFGEERQDDGSLSYGHRPASAAAIQREQHGAALAPGGESPLQVAFEYSDGGGTVLVTKVQAEPETEGGLLRWIANGKTILNNKGKPVKQYEPYLANSHTFEEPVEVGVTPVLYYDAAGRGVRTESPDGSFSRVAFSPWHVTSYDPNDTVLEAGNAWYAQRTDPRASVAEQRAARLTAEHADTPATLFLDSLGREVISVAHNRVKDSAGILQDEKQITFSKLDAEGKPLWIRDARGNLVMQYITPLKPTRAADAPDSANPENVPAGTVPCYDISGNLLCQHSMDGGDRWMINDAAGQPFYAWDENEGVMDDGSLLTESRRFHTVYDALRRPLEQQLQINGTPSQVIERFVYGETHAGAEARNLRGQTYRHYNASGLMTHERFDFKGNLLEVQRQLASAYQAKVIDWSAGSPTSGLEEAYSQQTEYDALNRMVRQENWHLAGRAPAIYTPQYNERGTLLSENLSVRGSITEAILNIEYDAKGQRQRIDTGNGTITRYHYDPQTFRLLQLRTTRNDFDPAFPAFHSEGSADNVLQQLSYTYDPVGNITEIHDEAYEPVFFRNQIVEPRSRYAYDALYRLIEAEGREQYGASGAPPQRPSATPELSFPISTPDDPMALRNYTQRYTYDPVGNIMQMRHVAARGAWTRNYAYAENSNRLLRTWLGGDELNTVRYDYDTHGSMLNLNRTPADYRLHWDTNDMVHQVNLGGGGQAWYNYASDKQRTRKRIERNGSTVEERLYLGGMERYRRWVGGSLVEEIETHHLFADDQRVLIVEDVLLTDDARLGTGNLFRYQYGNHLGSVGLELDADAAIISYEEFHPYGTTAYQANSAAVRATAKRYRYTGMERDEETGLSYHTARYYAPWLGRWGSADPIGIEGGENLFKYSNNNPLVYIDRNGNQSDLPSEDIIRSRAENQRGHFPETVSRTTSSIEALRTSIGAPNPWGWGYSTRGYSIRVDFTYQRNSVNYSFLGRIFSQLSDQGVTENIREQLEILRNGGSEGTDQNFDPELVLIIAAEETRGSQVFRTRGRISLTRDSSDNITGGTTFHTGGGDNFGLLVTSGLNGDFLPEDYTRGWTSLRLATDEHAHEINTLTNLNYNQLLAAYGAYIRHLRENVVFGSNGLTTEEQSLLTDNSILSTNTLRFLTRAAFGGSGRFREILGHLRTVASETGVAINDVINNENRRESLLDRIPYSREELSTKTIRRSLITTVQARELQSTRVFRESESP